MLPSMSCTPTDRNLISWCGLALSTAGYLLMLLTAAMFPLWRRSQVNQLWLHMCGTKLLWGYAMESMTIYIFVINCYDFNPFFEQWMYPLVVFTIEYLLLTSCSWTLAGAWLAHKQLVKVASTSDRGYMWKAALFCWLSTLPSSAMHNIVYYMWLVSNDFSNGLPVMFMPALVEYAVHLLLTVVCSVCLYSRVVYSVCRSGRDCGHRRNLLHIAVLAIMFALTSGLQYFFIAVYTYGDLIGLRIPETSIYSDINLIIVSYNVFMYSIIFVFGVKQTRQLWSEFWV